MSSIEIIKIKGYSYARKEEIAVLSGMINTKTVNERRKAGGQ